MNIGCGIVSILGTNSGSYSGSNCNGSRTVPASWANGGTLSLSIGTQTDKGDTNTALTNCPPSQTAVNAGLVDCNITGSSGSSSYSWNYTNDEFFYNGQPVPQQSTATLSASAALPGHTVNITGGTNWWGNSAGAPATGTGHTQSGSYYTVPAPSVYIGATRGTATLVTSNVSISPVTYACGQASSSVPPNPCTFTAGTVTGSFTVPSNMAPGAYNVYIDESNTTPLMGNGPNDSYQTARSTSKGTAESATSFTVATPPSITSADHASTAEGDAFSFPVTTSGTVASISKISGTLPTGITLTDNHNGTATIAGTAGVGTHGSYPITIKADSGLGGSTTQNFTLTVNVAPAITSQPNASASEGDAFSFTVQTDGVPTNTISKSGSLPTGLSFTDNGDNTATISGTPAAGTHGSYPLTFTATNGVDSPATQNFTLQVNLGASISSANNTTAVEGDAMTFTVQAGGVPTPVISHTGALPSGLSFIDNHDGTATLSGTAATGTYGSYPLTITANNGVDTPASQNFTLTVDSKPNFTSATSTSAAEGDPFSFNVTTGENPAAAIGETGDLPSGLSFVDNGDGTATISGTPDAGSKGTYPLTFSADNGVHSPVTQNFTLQVNLGASITSANSVTAGSTTAFSFTVTSTGLPTPALGETGGLPSGVNFVDNGDGTATISGTVPTGNLGSYPITITADNGVDTPATQNFNVVVQPTVTTSLATQSVTEGNNPSGVNMNIAVKLSEPAPYATSLHYQTNDGPGANPASNGSDYQATSGYAILLANQTSKNIPVKIYGDNVVENNETFTLSIAGPLTNLVLGSQTSTVVTILNDDHATLKIVGTNVAKPASGVLAAPVTVSLTNPVDAPVTVHWATADGTAKAGAGDYVAAGGDLTFSPGQQSQQVVVNVRGNQRLEDTRYYKLLLSNGATAIPGALTNSSASSTAQIYNTVYPTMVVNSPTIIEGSYAVIRVRLEERYYQPITLCYITSDGTATAPDRYTAAWNCPGVTIPAGNTAALPIAIPTYRDDNPEPATNFFVQVYDPNNNIPAKTSKVTIKANQT
jgi:hypothetical protein